MTKDELARAVVRVPGFVWADGLRNGQGMRRTTGPIGPYWQWEGRPIIRDHDPSPETPGALDLDDAATGGVLMAMVPMEHRQRIRWYMGWGGCWQYKTQPSSGRARWIDVDSLGHAAAAVIVDCGRAVAPTDNPSP